MNESERLGSRRVLFAIGGAVLCVGLLVLIGWAADIDPLKRILPGMATMKVNTAIGFILSGAALVMIQMRVLKDRGALPVVLVGLGVAGLGLVTLAQDAVGMSFGIDQLLIKDDPTSTARAPGRMSVATSLCFGVMGLATICLSLRHHLAVAVGQVLALLLVAVGLLGLVVYAYDVADLYAIGPFASMAMHTSACFAILGIGLFAVHPDRFLAATFSSQTTGGRIARELLPVLALSTFLLGLLHVRGSEAGWFGYAFSAALFTLSELALMVTLIVIYCRVVSRTEDELENRVAQRTAELQEKALRLQALAADLNEAEHRERQRISYMLHENHQQVLVAAKMSASDRALDDKPQGREKLRELINEAINSSRDLSVELYPPVLYTSGLVASIEWLCERMNDRFGLEIELVGEIDKGLFNSNINSFLFQCIRELLLNVVKHAGVSQATIELSQGRDHAQVRVSNKGAGLLADRAGLQKEDKTGFGLTNIQQRIEVMGGNCEIDDTDGFAITLTLPVQRDQVPYIAPATEPASVNAAEDDIVSIMIVDDHQILRELMMMELNDVKSFEVVGDASDGREAIDRAIALKPKVVLMDVSMPGVDGIAATRAICQELPGTMVLGLSMHEDDATRQQMLDAGAKGYMSKGKPFMDMIYSIRTVAKSIPD